MQNLSASQQAVKLTPMDPESHFASAEILILTGQPKDAILELERAVALRPSDYTLWLNLGLLRDQVGDTAAALSAFDEAIKRAPFYAEPRWQRGNLLLRSGRYDEAFNDLNAAARSEPALLPNLIDLAWALSKGNTELTQQLAKIDTEPMHAAFARLLARQGKAAEAVAQVRAAGNISNEVREELVTQLLAKSAFAEAYEIWRGGEPSAVNSVIQDGGFEGPLGFDQNGFEWRGARTIPAITLGMDSNKPHTGLKSLKVEFKGNANTDPPFISQLVLPEPAGKYRLNFAARSQDLVSGSLPTVVVIEATGKKRMLGRSAPLPKGTSDWQVSSFEFEVPAETTAIFVGVQREACATSPCPSFGSIWLDSFSIEQLPKGKQADVRP